MNFKPKTRKPFIVKTVPTCDFPDVRASLPVGSGGRPSGASDDRGLARMNPDLWRQAARQDRCDASALASRPDVVTAVIVFNNY